MDEIEIRKQAISKYENGESYSNIVFLYQSINTIRLSFFYQYAISA